VPGFDPHGTACTAPVLTSLEHLAALGDFRFLRWLRENRLELERQAGCPLAISGVAAAAMADLELAPDQGEMLHLLLRLPAAAVHALEQGKKGWARYPFFANGLKLTNDPGPYQGESQ